MPLLSAYAASRLTTLRVRQMASEPVCKTAEIYAVSASAPEGRSLEALEVRNPLLSTKHVCIHFEVPPLRATSFELCQRGKLCSCQT